MADDNRSIHAERMYILLQVKTHRPVVITIPTPAIALGVFAFDPDVPWWDCLVLKGVWRFSNDGVARERNDSLDRKLLGGIW